MDRIAIAGHRGMLGAALVRGLETAGVVNWRRTGHDRDLRDMGRAATAFAGAEVVFLAAGIGGGITKNLRAPAELALGTLRLLTGTLEGARRAGVSRFIWFGCACVYPRNGGAPLSPPDLWQGPLEPTSQAFAAAQLAGIELTRAYYAQHGLEALCLICPTLYGPGDDFSEDGHFVAGLIRRFHEAKVARAPAVTLWGTGRARRQVMYVDALAGAAIGVAGAAWFKTGLPVQNVAGDRAMGLAGYAEAVRRVVGYEGEICWSGEGPEGTPAKELRPDVFIPPFTAVPLDEGLRRTYGWFLVNAAHLPKGQNLGV